MFQMLKKRNTGNCASNYSFVDVCCKIPGLPVVAEDKTTRTSVVNVTRVMRFSNQKHCNIFVVYLQ